MRKISFFSPMFWGILVTLFGLAVSAKAIVIPLKNSEPSLPVVSMADFAPGTEYVWEYLENGQLYSTEMYRVVSSTPEKIDIEMWTKIPGQSDFSRHHRLEVNLTKCLQAYENPKRIRAWRLKMFYWRNEKWLPLEGQNSTLPFEEKFNCNAFTVQLPGKKAVLKSHPTALGESLLFQFRAGQKQDRTSWYFVEGARAAVLGFKRMSAVNAPVQYEIHLKK